mmetsp:Transcript_2344/g.6067  ORF Transcript_2344/g.6067 Transcript_2344/m.6067 type:complete len:384 (-) Transcript_2344:207-1358(-)
MFAVFSLLGGAAAFEVRRRTVVTTERRQLRQLREDRSSLDTLLQDLKGELTAVLSESASNKAAFEQIQAAAAALENRCADLAAANEELTTQRAALAGENDALRSSNAELGARLEAVEAAHAEEAGRLAGELEALKGEVKAAVEEFVDGMISADNLRARLDHLGVEVKFIEGDGSSGAPDAPPQLDDSWLLKLRSAFEPDRAAKLLSMGAGMHSVAQQDRAPLEWQAEPRRPPTCQGTAADRAERALCAQQARLHLGAAPKPHAEGVAPKAVVPMPAAIADKENSAATGRRGSDRARSAGPGKARADGAGGLSFQLGADDKQKASLKPRRGSFHNSLQQGGPQPAKAATLSAGAMPMRDATNAGLEFASEAGAPSFRSHDIVLR